MDAPPLAWGANGQWGELHDAAAVQNTIQMVGGTLDGRAWVPWTPAGRPRPGHPCHPCCEQARGCLPARLADYADGCRILGGASEPFGSAAAYVGVSALLACRTAVTHANVDDLYDPSTGRRPGPRTRARIMEIAAMGDLGANRIRREDPLQAAILQLAILWGVGGATARRLTGPPHGVRSLEDLLARFEEGYVDEDVWEYVIPRLPGYFPEIRAYIGMMYARDLRFTIPRDVGADIVARARATVADMWGLHRDTLDAGDGAAFAAALGSTSLGLVEETGDIDLLVAPPPGNGWPATKPALDAALNHFLNRFTDNNPNWVLDGVMHVYYSPARTVATAAATHGFGAYPARLDRDLYPFTAATWQGVVRAPGGTARRLDVKFYARDALAAGVAYMAGSKEWWLALKRFARFSPVARARAAALGGEFFHLGDTGLVPMRRWPRGEEAAGPPLPLACETDIYTHLGLAYVPFNRRTFDGRV